MIVEPIGGAGGVHLPPVGYLQRLREICDEYGILLIFDEVITGFGRIGECTAAERFGVTPDIMTTAKGITNATVPMGAVFVSDAIYDTFMSSSQPGVELNHGYTYSGHPLACAAGMATLDIYEQERLFDRPKALYPHWESSAMSLKGVKHVIDVRCFALIGAIEMAPRPVNPAQGELKLRSTVMTMVPGCVRLATAWSSRRLSSSRRQKSLTSLPSSTTPLRRRHNAYIALRKHYGHRG